MSDILQQGARVYLIFSNTALYRYEHVYDVGVKSNLKEPTRRSKSIIRGNHGPRYHSVDCYSSTLSYGRHDLKPQVETVQFAVLYS